MCLELRSRFHSFPSTTVVTLESNTELGDPAPVRAENPSLTVYYDGACPLCRKEISYYQRKDLGKEILWVDANECDSTVLGSDLTRQEALKRFHVRSADGELAAGGPAFAKIWQVLPGFRWLGRVAGSNGMSAALEYLYRAFLLLRPAIQRVLRRAGR